MFLAKYDLDVYLDLFFGLNSLRIYSSVMFERHISKKHKNVPGSDLNFHWFDGRWPLRPRTDGYEPIDSTTGYAFVWLVVNVIPIPKDQDNPWRFSFYFLFTDITYKFEYRSSSNYSLYCQTSGDLPVYLYKQSRKQTKEKFTSFFKLILNKSFINLLSTN